MPMAMVFSCGGGDDLVGVVFVDEGDPPESAQEGEGFLYSREEISFIKVGDELGDHFRVGVGVEGPAGGFEHVAKGGVVFDDPVVDDGDGFVLVEMGVGIFFRGFAVGGPAGMRNGEIEAQGVFAEGVFEGVELSHLFTGDDLPFEDAGEAGGIVPAVLEVFEAGQADVCRVAGSDVSEYATHREASVAILNLNITKGGDKWIELECL